MPFYDKGDVRIRYEEAGSGFPLLVTPGGGLNSRVSNWPTAVINAMEAFKDDFRCITIRHVQLRTRCLGPRAAGPAARDHHGEHRGLSAQPLARAPGLRVQLVARVRSILPDADARDAGRHAGAPLSDVRGHCRARAEVAVDGVSLERA